jgi:hypothetical protein
VTPSAWRWLARLRPGYQAGRVARLTRHAQDLEDDIRAAYPDQAEQMIAEARQAGREAARRNP